VECRPLGGQRLEHMLLLLLLLLLLECVHEPRLCPPELPTHSAACAAGAAAAASAAAVWVAHLAADPLIGCCCRCCVTAQQPPSPTPDSRRPRRGASSLLLLLLLLLGCHQLWQCFPQHTHIEAEGRRVDGCTDGAGQEVGPAAERHSGQEEHAGVGMVGDLRVSQLQQSPAKACPWVNC
jgi:hypothetical protein